MKTSDFDFFLPENLIASSPVEPRDAAKMLVVKNQIKDFAVKNLPDFLEEGDVMVFNNTKVIPARIFGECKGKKIEILLHKKSGNEWAVFAKPGKKMLVGEKFIIAENFYAEIKEKLPSGEVILSFNKIGEEFFSLIEKHGHTPLPPYIKREDTEKDKTTYQTVYAEHKGSVAAPTAGLHFTDELLNKIKQKGVKILFVTLHVGAGTFQPVKTENIKEHKMHSEFCTVSKDVANEINNRKGRVIAVGTTSMRTLESVADERGILKEFSGETDIFIYPGYKFKLVDVLMTNFHLPKSTLFMLVSAFAGKEKMKQAYSHAIEKKYRFFSYGDSSLLFRV